MKLNICKTMREYRELIEAYQKSGETVTLYGRDQKYLNRGIVTLVNNHSFTIRETYNSKIIVEFEDMLINEYYIGS